MFDVKKYSSPLLIIAAVIMAGVASYIAIIYLDKREKEIQKNIHENANYKRIIVAKRDLQVGEALDSSNLSVREVPEAYVPDDAFPESEFSAFEGRVLSQPVSFGKTLLPSHIHGFRGVSSFSYLVEKGKRAVTLEISNLESNENMLKAGDYIDILHSAKGVKDELIIMHFLVK